MKLSVVTTLYGSAPYVSEFCSRASAAARQLAGDDYELVLVNDGSPDDSLERAIRMSESDRHVVVVDLSRNFGHQKAVLAGLAHARGELVYVVDCDLEEEPEWLLEFAATMRDEGGDSIYGVQRRRKGEWMDRVIGQWFYDLHRAVTGITLPENVTTARLMTRRFVDALAQHDDRELYLEGLFQLTGFVQRPVAVTKHHTSRTTYTMSRKIAIVVDSVTATSGRPFSFMVLVGGAAISGALLYLVVTAGRTADEATAMWTFLLGSVWLLGGAIILCLGILGTYLWKALLEAKRRPRAIVRRVYGRDAD